MQVELNAIGYSYYSQAASGCMKPILCQDLQDGRCTITIAMSQG